jgi:tight adherence protein B
MRRLTAIVLLAVALSAWLLAPAAAADGGPRLTESSNAPFPDRSYLLSLPPGTSARPDQIQVREDGNRVSDLSVLPASAASSRGFGVVLVIDASRSMKGRAIREAMGAARAFARRRHPNQQLGVVTFNGRSVVALPLTQDEGDIDEVLDKPPVLARDTHVYDAVDTAVRMLASAQLRPASVVVLSDGSDTGSRIRSGQAAASARRNGVRVFSVGLRSGAFDPKSLAGLARDARGAYSEASGPGDLARIYDELGARLANEHLIVYRSLAGPKDRVHVNVQVDGVPGAATAEYTTPALRTAVEPYRTNDFWSSPAALFLVSLTCGGLLIASVYFAFSRPGRRKLRRRLSQFVSPAPPEQPQGRDAPGLVVSPRFMAGFGRAFEGMRWWPRFEEELDVARITTPPTQLVGATVIGTLVTTLLLGMATGNPLIALIGLLIPLAVRWFVKFKLERQRKHFAEQLADNLQVISSALRAGHSLVGAMAVAVQDAPEPTKREFERVVADEKLGVSLEDGLSVVARRMDSRDLQQVMIVASLQRETGGNTAEVLDRVADTVRERADLRRMIATLTAQGGISRWVVSALPIVLGCVISVINPSYLNPLFQTTPGHFMLVVAAILLVSGSLTIKKIVNIKV